MPKLMILAACEKVIIDRNFLPSLINIFQRMNIQLQAAPLPEKAVSPARWSVFTLWQHIPEEKDIEYTQHLEVISPNGDKFFESAVQFKITEDNDLQSKNQLDLFGLPINDEGFITIRVWLEGIENSTGEYQFFVKHHRKESNEQVSSTQIN